MIPLETDEEMLFSSQLYTPEFQSIDVVNIISSGNSMKKKLSHVIFQPDCIYSSVFYHMQQAYHTQNDLHGDGQGGYLVKDIWGSAHEETPYYGEGIINIRNESVTQFIRGRFTRREYENGIRNQIGIEDAKVNLIL